MEWVASVKSVDSAASVDPVQSVKSVDSAASVDPVSSSTSAASVTLATSERSGARQDGPARHGDRDRRTPGAHQLTFGALGTPLIDTTFVVLDLETTGLSPRADRITEIGAVKVRGGEVLGELRTFVHPGRPVPPAVTAVTGITDVMLRDAPPTPVVLPTVLRFLDGAVLVAHNAPFDVGFLRAAALRHGQGSFEPVVVDTARLSRRLLKEELRDCRLETVARHLRARTSPEHRALADARATVDVLHALIERAGSYGATTLEDLRDLARSTNDRTYRRISLVRDAPDTCGVYRFLDERDEVLYVGKATSLRTRLRSYFGQDRRRRTADLVRDTSRVTWQPTPTLIEAEVRELRLIQRYRPHYNRRSKGSQAPVHVAITREAFPRLAIVRKPRPGHARTVGPFASRRTAERLVEALQTTTSIRSCTGRLRVAQDHSACVLAQLGRCGAPCDGSQTRSAYASVVEGVEAAFDDPSTVLRRLRSGMEERATQGRYERALEIRAQLHATARAFLRLREQQALACVRELVVAHQDRQRTDVVVIRSGRFVGSLRLEAPASDGHVLREVARAGFMPPPISGDVDVDVQGNNLEETGLLLDWLAGPDRRLVHAQPAYALPGPGGHELATTVDEGRRVARAVRHDRQRLDVAKVVRRTRDETALTAAT